MEWGTDHFDFMLEGVPTFVADQDEANYLENYHAVSDTYDKVDFVQLKKNVAEAAEFIFRPGQSSGKDRPPLHPRTDRTILARNRLRTNAENSGMWDAWQSGKLGRQK